ncbi:microtubule-associated protein 6 homolog isoform X1 [Electrophorus electricus]|uniref:Microtubule-associated protein 6b n=1 Tax=Electrophorus electricus TaxID=8005 RepID=A0A4W4EAB0_ELEEL|nr:microtubule-associated protein 6 homolog isoform X1 [Electrophorus electricus]
MAWPCITRACCINRFWSELDKADIAVPLVFTRYSDVAEVQQIHPQPKSSLHPQRRGPVTIETQPAQEDPAKVSRAADAAASPRDGSSASVMRQDFKAWRIRPEPSCKPKNEYHPSEAPFNNETQYQKDYKAWPIPRKGDHPWIPKASPPASGMKAESAGAEQEPAKAADETGVEKCEIEEKVREKETKEKKKKAPKKEKTPGTVGSSTEKREPTAEAPGRSVADALNMQIKQEVTSGSLYRTEFKAYTDVPPVKPIKAKWQYKPPVAEKASLETSYSATYRGEQSKPGATDNKVLERRRIRSLYSEPSSKDPSKVERPSVSLSRPKKMTSHSKPVNKVKAKQGSGTEPAKKKPSASSQSAKKKPSVTSLSEGGVTKKSKEIINRLAEAKD